LIVVVILVIAQLVLPRRYGFLPLLIAACHLGNQEIAGEFTIVRILIALGLLRATVGGYFVWSPKCKLDVIIAILCSLLILSAAGHNSESYNPWIAHMGWVYNILGSYLYGRAYLTFREDFRRFVCLVPMVLIPLAAGLVVEKTTQLNSYFVFGSASRVSAMRDGKIRASGPFRHPILTGTVGAVSIPFAAFLMLRRSKVLGACGLVACAAIVISSNSSGPLSATIMSALGFLLWKRKDWMGFLRKAALGVALLYWVVKGRGPWFLMASIDLTGGSTGWHRAHLIDQAYHHLGEWWLCGTDFTRHWMSTGVSWSTDHADITNYYLHLGVLGGLPVMITFIMALVKGFSLLGSSLALEKERGDPDDAVLLLWCAGMSLATHALSFVSISYFDQMFVPFYLLLAAIPGLTAKDPTEESEDSEWECERQVA
jgi:hypothetical protein